jgi:hypothetical protein
MKHMKAFHAACTLLAVAAAVLSPCIALAQDPAAPAAPTAAAPQYSADELEQLVGPVALYPDDLLAILLPAATYPLDVVKAQRFLDKRKVDSNLQPDPGLPEPVRNLLNYPEVIQKMNDDLDWVEALGEAVVSQQSSVLDAIQRFRRKAAAAGSLKTDDKQIVVTEKEVVKVVPADPEVIYVPQYQPSTVVVQSAPPAYYPTPYPCYYYPYAPGAAFATGLFIGAATAWAFNWGGGSVEHNVNINNTDNINVNRNNQRTQESANRARAEGAKRTQNTAAGQGQRGQSWRSEKQPGQVSSGRAQPRNTARPGDAQFGAGGGGGPRASTSDLGGRDAGGRDAGGRDSGGRDAGGRDAGGRDVGGRDAGGRDAGGFNTGAGGRGSASNSGRAGGDAFSGMGSGSSTARASDRGASSRASSGQRSAGASRPSGGGGRSAGGARGGGGGGRRR